MPASPPQGYQDLDGVSSLAAGATIGAGAIHSGADLWEASTLPSAHATRAQVFCIADDLAILPGSGASGGLRVYDPDDTTKYARIQQVGDVCSLITTSGLIVTFDGGSYVLGLPAGGITCNAASGFTQYNETGADLIHTARVGWRASAFGSLDTSLWRRNANEVSLGAGGASGVGWLSGKAGHKRLAAAVPLPDTTMVNLTDLTVTLPLGNYTGFLFLPVNAALAADGFKLDLDGGAAVVSSVHFGFASALGATLGVRTSTALATDITLTALADTSDVWLDIPITMVVSTAGTIIPRAAKVADAGGDATIRLGGYLVLDKLEA